MASRAFSLGNPILEDYVVVFTDAHLLLYQLRSYDLVTNTLDLIKEVKLQDIYFLGQGAELIAVSEVIKIGSIVVQIIVEYKVDDSYFLAQIGIS